MTANESEIGGTPGCNYSDVATETHTQYANVWIKTKTLPDIHVIEIEHPPTSTAIFNLRV